MSKVDVKHFIRFLTVSGFLISFDGGCLLDGFIYIYVILRLKESMLGSVGVY